MLASLVRIGNSRGRRIPKAVLEQTGLQDEVELDVRGSQLVIRSADHPRAGWDEAFARMPERECGMLDEDLPTNWDKSEWEW
jgi:antitoxin MazE